MPQPLPPAPDKAYDPDSYRSRVGAYAGQIHEVRWGYYKGWPHGQVRRAIVRKRWFQVVLHAGKPQDFERSEQIVLTGQMANDRFEASDMLLKCPSKYNDQEIYVRSEKKS